ncbi:MAG: hypothetical protein ACK47B_07545 [Armatimonadota bacterium]
MRSSFRVVIRLLVCFCLFFAVLSVAPAEGAFGRWRQVHERWQNAYVLSFRSPDLLSNERDEKWGRKDARLVSGRILSDFPVWLDDHAEVIRWVREEGRPVLLSLHVHSGFGTGLVTYSDNLTRGEVASYPWLVRTLLERGLSDADVTVAVDTCNAQATAAHQLRPDLIPRGVEAWPPFARWRKADAARSKMPVAEAYPLFARDRVAQELRSGSRSRNNVRALPYAPLTPEERRRFRARLYGPKGVILATPALFNLLRLGPNPRGTLTADLLNDRLDPRLVDGLLSRNNAEFRLFRELEFLSSPDASFR